MVLQIAVSRIAVSFVLVNIRLNGRVSRIAVSFIRVYVRLNSSVSRGSSGRL